MEYYGSFSRARQAKGMCYLINSYFIALGAATGVLEPLLRDIIDNSQFMSELIGK